MIIVKIIRNILNFFDNFHQNKIIKLISTKFDDKIVIIDVGAHFGETIKKFRNKLSVKKIYSFEASPINFKELKNNKKKYNPTKVEIFNYGLGENNFDGFINQTIESSSSTINRINTNSKYYFRKIKILNIKKKEKYYEKLPIKLISLDKFINEKNISKIDLLKIDTEGYEYNVLKGLKKSHQIIKLIYFEHHYDDMIIKNYKFGDIHQILTNYGFERIFKTKMLFRKSFEYIYENKKT